MCAHVSHTEARAQPCVTPKFRSEFRAFRIHSEYSYTTALVLFACEQIIRSRRRAPGVLFSLTEICWIRLHAGLDLLVPHGESVASAGPLQIPAETDERWVPRHDVVNHRALCEEHVRTLSVGKMKTTAKVRQSSGTQTTR